MMQQLLLVRNIMSGHPQLRQQHNVVSYVLWNAAACPLTKHCYSAYYKHVLHNIGQLLIQTARQDFFLKISILISTFAVMTSPV